MKKIKLFLLLFFTSICSFGFITKTSDSSEINKHQMPKNILPPSNILTPEIDHKSPIKKIFDIVSELELIFHNITNKSQNPVLQTTPLK